MPGTMMGVLMGHPQFAPYNFCRPQQKLKIGITGAGGFIASHLARRLMKEGHYIVACDWKKNEYFKART